jgi:peptide/nickel transport system permease protein
MWRFIVWRLLATIPTIAIVVTISFFLIHFIPGDPVAVMLGPEATEEQVASVRAAMGLDKPLLEQFRLYVQRVFTADLGESIIYGIPVRDLLVQRAEVTVTVGLIAIGVVALFGVIAGVIAAAKANSWIDQALLLVALVGVSLPSFWMGLLLIQYFAEGLRVLPSSGFRSVFGPGGIRNLRYLVLPALTLGVRSSALLARMTRSSMLEVLGSDYVSTARAKGLREARVILKHAFRNAAIPVLTLFAMTFASLLAGTVVTETVFALPGMGRLVVQAAMARDYPVIQALMLVFASLFLFANLATDILFSMVDPRIRYD